MEMSWLWALLCALRDSVRLVRADSGVRHGDNLHLRDYGCLPVA